MLEQIDDPVKVDEYFRKRYEMNFESFKRILKTIIELGLADNDYFETLIRDFKVWKLAREKMRKI